MTLATYDDAMAEYARNMGDQRADQQWLLSDYDVWVKNPHYVGPPQPHPEDDSGYYDGPQSLVTENDIDDEIPW